MTKDDAREAQFGAVIYGIFLIVVAVAAKEHFEAPYWAMLVGVGGFFLLTCFRKVGKIIAVLAGIASAVAAFQIAGGLGLGTLAATDVFLLCISSGFATNQWAALYTPSS